MKQLANRLPALIVTASLALVCLLPVAVAQDGSQCDQIHREAYIAFVKAEQARDEGNSASSVELFVVALELYRQLQSDYPGWHRKIVETRIPQCEKEIRKAMNKRGVSERLGISADEVLASRPASAGQDYSTRERDDLIEEISRLRFKLQNAQPVNELQPGTSGSEALRQRLALSEESYSELESRYSELSRSYEELLKSDNRGSAVHLPGSSESEAALREEVRRLRGELLEMAREIEEPEPSGGSGDGDVRKLKSQLSAKESEYRKLKREYDRLPKAGGDTQEVRAELTAKEESYSRLESRHRKLISEYKRAVAAARQAKAEIEAMSSVEIDAPVGSSRREKELYAEIKRLRRQTFELMKSGTVTVAVPEAGDDSEMRDELKRSEKALSKLETDYRKLKKRYESLVDKNTDLRKKVDSADGSKAADSRRVKDLKAEVTRLKRQIREMAKSQLSEDDGDDAEMEELKAKLSGLNGKYSKLVSHYTKLREKYREASETAEAMSKVDPADQTAREKGLVKEIARLRAEMRSLAKDQVAGSSSFEQELTEAKRAYARLKSDHERLKGDYSILLKSVKVLEGKVDGVEPTQRDDGRERKLAADVADLKVKLDRAVRENDSLRAEAAEAGRRSKSAVIQDQKYALLKKDHSNLLMENQELKAQVREAPQSQSVRATAPTTAVSDRTPTRKVASGSAAEAVKLMQKGEFARAEEAINEGLRRNKNDADLQYLLGTIRFNEGDYKATIKIMNSVVDADEGYALARVVLGQSYFMTGDYFGARMELEMAAGIDPDLASAHFSLSQVLLESSPSDPEGARTHYNEALRLGSPRDNAHEARMRSALKNAGLE